MAISYTKYQMLQISQISQMSQLIASTENRVVGVERGAWACGYGVHWGVRVRGTVSTILRLDCSDDHVR